VAPKPDVEQQTMAGFTAHSVSYVSPSFFG
jgi:hypothetical protein